MATALQAKIQNLGEKLREENRARECELLKGDGKSLGSPNKPRLKPDSQASTRQLRPGTIFISIGHHTLATVSRRFFSVSC